MVPNLATGQEVNTDALLKIAGQGAVYVRLLEPYNITDSDTDSECEERLIQTSLNFESSNSVACDEPTALPYD